MTRLALIVVLLSACKIRNEQSCDIPGNCDESCKSTPDCDGSGVCKLPDGICVACLESTDCDQGSNQPTCNPATNMCEACKVSADCPSQACDVPKGTCFPETQVAYVEADASGTCESAASPCGSLTAAVATNRPVIKLLGSAPIVGPTKIIVVDRPLLVVGDADAMPVLRTTTGPTFEVRGTLTIRDVELSQNGDGDGIAITNSAAVVTLEHVFLLDHPRLGINAMAGSKLVMRACVVAGNDVGGLLLNDLGFEITNTLLVGNGSSTSAVGGMRTVSTNDPGSVIFEFNTIAENFTMSAEAAHSSVDCSAGFPAHNNIVAGVAGGFVIEPPCTFDHSLFTGGMLVGEGNESTTDVRFLDRTVGHEREADFFRVQADSPAVDKVPTSSILVDIDGQPRPQGAMMDIGADEVMQ